MGKVHSKQESPPHPPPEDFVDLCKNSKYTAKELQEWHSTFIAHHPSHAISSEEVVEAYIKQFPNGKACAFAENLFRFFDANHDGKIDFREIVIAMGTACRGSHKEKLGWIFSLYDINGNGFISKEEMRIVLKCIIRLMLHGTVQARLDAIVEEHMKKIFLEVDVNGDDVISLKEFLSVKDSNTVFMDVLEKGIKIMPK